MKTSKEMWYLKKKKTLELHLFKLRFLSLMPCRHLYTEQIFSFLLLARLLQCVTPFF